MKGLLIEQFYFNTKYVLSCIYYVRINMNNIYNKILILPITLIMNAKKVYTTTIFNFEEKNIVLVPLKVFNK